MSKIQSKSLATAIRACALGAVASSILVSQSVIAAPAAPGIKTFTQPSGETIHAQSFGDEWFGWYQTSDGDIFTFNPATKFFEYAEAFKLDGKWVIEPSGIKLGDALNGFETLTPTQLREMWNTNSLNFEAYQAPTYAEGATAAEQSAGVESGASLQAIDLPTLMIAISFTDEVIDSSDSTWNQLIFSTAPGKLNHYFQEATHGQFQVSPAAETYGTANDGIVRALLSYPHPNPGRATQQDMLRDALEAVDTFVDFAQYDTNSNGQIDSTELQIGFIVAGKESAIWGEDVGVWAHVTSLSTTYRPTLDGKAIAGRYFRIGEEHWDGLDASIGIIGHEMGHSAMFLPDLYTSGDDKGISRWGMMANGSWARVNGQYQGETPTHFSAWSKITRGFVNYREIGTSSVPTEYTVQSFDTGNYDVVRINTNNPDEYFLVENRQNIGYDRGLAGTNTEFFNASSGGLAIFHIDTTQYGRRGVKMERADGADDGTHINNLFWAGNATEFNSLTTPNANLMDGSLSGVAISDVSASGTAISFLVQEESEPPFLCAAVSDTISNHVTAGRAELRGGTCWGTFCWGGTYYTIGGDDNLGTSSYTTVTVKEADEGIYKQGDCLEWTIQIDTVEPLEPNGFRVVGTSPQVGDDDLDSITFKVDNGDWQAAGVGPGHWVAAATGLSAGDHTMTIRITDVGGKFAETSTTYTIVNTEPSAPTIDSYSVSTGPAASNPLYGNVIITGTASDVDGNLQQVIVTSLDGNGSLGCAIDDNTSANFTCEFSQQEGTFSYEIHAVDATSLESDREGPISVTITFVPPTVDSITATPNGLEVTVAGTASDADLDLDFVEIEFNDSGNWITVSGTDSWTYTETGLGAGNHTVKARATDENGHVSAETQAVAFTLAEIQQSAPSIDSISVSVAGGDATVSGTASDVDGDLASVEVQFNNDGNWIVATGTTNWSYLISTLGDGTHTVKARAKDAGGLISAESNAETFTIDTSGGQCFTTTLSDHVAAGRAADNAGVCKTVGGLDALSSYYSCSYVVSWGDPLFDGGQSANPTYSIEETSPGNWNKVASCP